MDPEEENSKEDQGSSSGGSNGAGGRKSGGSRIGNTAKGAASGAAKEAGKQAVIQGAKGAAQGAAKGAQAGAAAGSVVPVVGTAIGGALGAAGGAAAGGAAGATKGAAQGAAQGAVKGAAKGAAKNPRKDTTAPETETKDAIKKGAGKIADKGMKAAGPEAQAAWKAFKFINRHKNLRRIAIVVATFNNPLVIGIGIAVGVLLLIIFVMGDPAEGDPRPKLTITKSGPTEAQLNEELTYQINVTYPAQAIDIVVTDRIPEGTEYIDSSPSAKFDSATKTATWNLKDYAASSGAILSDVNITLALKLRAIADNLVLVNQAEGTVTPYTPPGGGGGPISADIAKLLPNPLPPDVEGTQGEKTAALDAISANRAVYEKVAAATGVPWQVFAGIHYREGGAGPTKSIVSGREIGANEPDVTEGPGCSASAPIGAEDGEPEVSGQFCVFSSLVDSGIYGGNLLKRKVAGDINNFEVLVEALSNYNGGGNANCDKTPYTGCPRHFYGEDDTYVMNLFDNRHVPMYIVYCADRTKCNPPVEDGRPGTATVTKWAAQGIK